MQIKLDKELYPKETILKAANMFLDRYYVYLDTDEKYYLIDLESKSGQTERDVEKQFLNEALIQSARYSVMQQTKTIRELVLGRAFASTIIDDTDTGFIDDENINSEDILHNWFDVYEQ